MITFRIIEPTQFCHFQDDRLTIIFLSGGDVGFDDGFIHRIGEVDPDPILGPDVMALLIQQSRIDEAEKMLQDLGQGNDVFVIAQFTDFGVFGLAGTDFLIGWIFSDALGIPDPSRVEGPKNGGGLVDNPTTATPHQGIF